ncbi:SDR family oxidoreductase [Aurantivibrio plasticivorans]
MKTSHPKSVIVTGASRGIGELTAKLLATKGHTVYATMRDVKGRNAERAQRLKQWATQSNVNLGVVELDVTSKTSITSAVTTIEENGPIDVLVNNAGIMPVGVTEAFSIEQTKELFDVNMFGLAATSQAVLPSMRNNKSGLIINISSAAGRLAIPYFGIYCASKWAMEAYSESLNYELAPFNIQSVLVEPSGHATELVNNAPSPSIDSTIEQYGPHANGREKLLGMFTDLFEQGNADNDAQNVADRICDLIEMEGPRPIRTQVGDDMGVAAINDATAPVQAGLIEQLAQVYGVEQA